MEVFKNNMEILLKAFKQEQRLSSSHNLMQGNISRSTISKIAEAIIQLGQKLGASDIHLEPGAESCNLRLRLDGVLRQIYIFQKDVHQALVSYLKIMGGLDISEKRLPQDGAILLVEKELDLRISVIPVIWGEKIVLRLLAKGAKLWRLEQVGFTSEDYEKYLGLLQRSSGLVVITGPVNSGKSTLLYASLAYLQKEEVNIITVEDPVEIKLVGINQMQVNHKAGLDYEMGLRAMLRQDPDIMMIGEIRDEVVAKEALRAALTGHLVLTTIHTKNSWGIIPRLLNMGVGL